MGVSTDAILFYGFTFYDQDSGAPEGFEHLEGAAEDAWTFHNWSTDSKYVEIDTHCSNGSPMYFVSVKKPGWVAWRGRAVEIDPAVMGDAAQRLWDLQIKEFCEEHNIPYQQPKWFLASYWG